MFPVILPAVLAAWLGVIARQEISASDGQLAGRGHVTTALVLAAWSLVLTANLIAAEVS
jgi:hypothetical protein